MHKRRKGRLPHGPKIEEPLSQKIYIYARVSKEDGSDATSQSIDNQVLRCREFIADFAPKRFPEHTFVPDNLYIDDGVSGGKPFSRRPGGGRLNLKLKPGDVVVMTSWDRGFRNLLDFLDTFERWRKEQVYVVTVNMPLDPTDEMHVIMIKMMGLMADTERALITKRIRDAVECRIKQGRFSSSGIPYGFKKAGTKGNYLVIPNKYERRLGQLIVDLYDSQEISFYGVQERLREIYKQKQQKWLLWRDTGEVPHGIRCREIYTQCKAGWPYYKGRSYEEIVGRAPPEDDYIEGDDD